MGFDFVLSFVEEGGEKEHRTGYLQDECLANSPSW